MLTRNSQKSGRKFLRGHFILECLPSANGKSHPALFLAQLFVASTSLVQALFFVAMTWITKGIQLKNRQVKKQNKIESQAWTQAKLKCLCSLQLVRVKVRTGLLKLAHKDLGGSRALGMNHGKFKSRLLSPKGSAPRAGDFARPNV